MLFGWPTCIQPKVMLGFGSQQAAADDISRFVHADVIFRILEVKVQMTSHCAKDLMGVFQHFH